MSDDVIEKLESDVNQRLDNLQQEAEKLVALLKDRHFGIPSWVAALNETAEEVMLRIQDAGLGDDDSDCEDDLDIGDEDEDMRREHTDIMQGM
jgi:hypothetical protein